MKEVVFGIIALGVVGAGIYKGIPATSAANTYKMTPAQAAEKLMARDIVPDNRAFNSAFGMLEVEVTNPSPDKVVFSASGDHATALCEATLIPVETTHVRIDTSCDSASPSDGAAQDATQNMLAIGFHEHVASIMEDRPFNEQVVMAASTAAFARQYPGMVKNAVQMDADMRRERYEEAQGGQ
jgi:hypothetical protein